MKKIALLTVLCSLVAIADYAENGAVTLEQSGKACTIRNDFVSVYINKDGEIRSFLFYKSGDRNSTNSVQLIEGTGSQGYFSYATSDGAANYGIKNVYVKQQTDDIVEVQYVTNVVGGLSWTIGYIVCRDVAGCYNYAIVKGSASSLPLSEARMGLRVSPSTFTYAYVNDDLQAPLPTPAQMTVGGDGGCTEVTDATYQLADGSIYTKYDYAAFQKDDAVHGIMGNQVGVWMINPSTEWLNGGVMRQDLTLHATDTSPILLRHFHGNHFGGTSVLYSDAKEKMYGPHLIYVNQSVESDVATAHNNMIADAKAVAEAEQVAWPYNWVRDAQSHLYPKQRGTVTGQITLGDDAEYFGTTRFQVILAQHGSKPMLQGDDFMFWNETDDNGNFTIEKVRPGTYSLFAYALNGAATDYFEVQDVTVTANEENYVGTLTWTPDKYGKILWQIGEANHLSSGYNMSGKKREFGQWEAVPAELTYTIGESNPETDWYYAQTHNDNWFIYYQLDEVPTKPLRLTVATAGTANVKMKVRSNETRSSEGVGVFRPEHDGSVSRSATLAGRDSLVVFDIPVSTLKKGQNYLNFNVWGIPESGMGGIMYDCIKLEAAEEDIVDGAAIILQDKKPACTKQAVYDLFGRKIAKKQISPGLYIINGKKYVIQ